MSKDVCEENKLGHNKFELDIEAIWRHVIALSNFTDRLAGTENIEKASNYIVNYLEKMEGVRAWIDRFYFLTSYPEYSYFEIIKPESKIVNSFPNLFSENTAPEGVTGDLIYVGSGDEESYQGIDAAGKLVLAELSYSPPRTEKARIASINNAKVLIVMNWGYRESRIVGRGAIKGVWGPPTPEDIERIPRIISLNISRHDGEYLKRLLSHQRVKARIKVKVENKWVCSSQPMCRIYSACPQPMDEFIIVGGHLEAWGGTVTDNSAGNAVMLEMVKILAENRSKILRNIVFGFWDGHEIGEAAGSAWFVDNNWVELNEGGLAYLNVDACGLAGASRFLSYSSPETWTFLEEVEKEVIGKPSEKRLPLKFGDNSFLGIGIPYIFTFATFTEEELKNSGEAIFGWWYHSEEDTIDKLDREILGIQAKLYLEYVLRLACEPVVPFDFIQFTRLVKTDIAQFKEAFSKEWTEPYLSKIEARVNELEALIYEVNKIAGECRNSRENALTKSVNKLLLTLSRILTPAFRSTVDKYSHDIYGNIFLAKPLPRVYKILANLTKTSREDWTWYALKVSLTRQFNILIDALLNASFICRVFLSKI